MLRSNCGVPEDVVTKEKHLLSSTSQPQAMNLGGLSPEAQVRLARHGEGAGGDLPVPELDDHETVGAWRRNQHAAWGEGHVDGEIEHVPTSVAEVPCLLARSPRVATDSGSRQLMHLHGGGFCLGSPGADIPITARLAHEVDTVSVDYALAPERGFPAAGDDCFAVYRELAATGPVVISGISAGGNLAVGVALRCAEAGLEPPVGLVLLSPHLRFSTGQAISPLSAAYLGMTDRTDPSAAPAFAADADLAKLPPTLVQVTNTESFYEAAVDFAGRLDALGVTTTLQVWDGLWHGWHYHRELPQAWDAVDRAAAWAAELAS